MFNDFYVICVISNPRRYSVRYKLWKRFEQYMERCGAKLYTVELRYGERPWELAHRDYGRHINLETYDELWHKENMINVGVQHLPDTWKYMAWIDADIEFIRPDWIEETVHMLQHHYVVQMFQTAIDLGPNQEHLATHHGFVYQYHRNTQPPKAYGEWHPGFAWAIRRDAWDMIGGLIDTAILGAADNHMAKGLIGRVSETIHKDIHPEYAHKLFQWQERAVRHLKMDVGYVPGTIYHMWHGKKRDRRYWDRWKILVENQFNPDTDLKKDWQGIWQLEVHDERQMRLRDQLRYYFQSRNEDSIDLE